MGKCVSPSSTAPSFPANNKIEDHFRDPDGNQFLYILTSQFTLNINSVKINRPL